MATLDSLKSNILKETSERGHTLANTNLLTELQNLILFSDQTRTVAKDLATPSINKNRIIAILSSAEKLYISLRSLPKEKVSELNNSLNFFNDRNLSFVHSLEDKLRPLYEHFLSKKSKKKIPRAQ